MSDERIQQIEQRRLHEAEGLADLCSRAGAVCGRGLLAEVERLAAELRDARAEVERLRERERALIRAKGTDLDDVRDEAKYWHEIATKAKDQRNRAERERDEARQLHNDALIENERLRAGSIAANAVLREIHDTLGLGWNAADDEHDAAWTESDMTVQGVVSVVAERDDLRAKLAAAKAERERLLHERAELWPAAQIVPTLESTVEYLKSKLAEAEAEVAQLTEFGVDLAVYEGVEAQRDAAERQLAAVLAVCDRADRAQQPRSGVLGYVMPSQVGVDEIRHAAALSSEGGTE